MEAPPASNLSPPYLTILSSDRQFAIIFVDTKSHEFVDWCKIKRIGYIRRLGQFSGFLELDLDLWKSVVSAVRV